MSIEAPSDKPLNQLEQNLQALNRKPDPVLRKKLIAETYAAILALMAGLGAAPSPGVGEVFKSAAADDLIVRREDPGRLLQALSGRQSIDFTLDPKLGRYANCTLWRSTQSSSQSEAMKMALQEGQGTAGGLAVVMGARSKGLDVQKVVGKPDYVGSAEGTVRPEDIRFVTVRIPVKFFPNELLTQDERLEAEDAEEEGNVLQIFRSFIFDKKKDAA